MIDSEKLAFIDKAIITMIPRDGLRYILPFQFDILLTNAEELWTARKKFIESGKVPWSDPSIESPSNTAKIEDEQCIATLEVDNRTLTEDLTASRLEAGPYTPINDLNQRIAALEADNRNLTTHLNERKEKVKQLEEQLAAWRDEILTLNEIIVSISARETVLNERLSGVAEANDRNTGALSVAVGILEEL